MTQLNMIRSSMAGQPSSSALPRYDLYKNIHKALRALMADTLVAVGKLDVRDAAQLSATVRQAEDLLALAQKHLEHEDDLLHPAILAAMPTAELVSVSDHVHHERTIRELEDILGELNGAPEASRDALCADLYAKLCTFVGDNLLHMRLEETVNNEALWAAYSDAEILALEERILAKVSRDEMQLSLRWMVPAMTPIERSEFVRRARATLPKQAFDNLLEYIRSLLECTEWQKLIVELGANDTGSNAAKFTHPTGRT